RDLPVLDRHVLPHDLGDAQVAQGLRRGLDRGLRRGLPRLSAGPHQLRHSIDAVCHVPTSSTVQLPQIRKGLRNLRREPLGLVATQVDHLLRDSLLEEIAALLHQLLARGPVPAELERSPDLRRVATDRGARLLQLLALLAHPRRVATRRVPHVGVPSDQAHRRLTGRADPQRRVWLLHRLRVRDRVLHPVVAAVEVRPLLGPERLDDPQRLAQPADAVVETLEAVHLVLDLGPRRADAELEAAARKVVDRHRLLGEQRRVAVRVAGDQASDAHAPGRLGHRRLERPALEDRAVRAAGADRCEVVEVPHVVEAALVRNSPYGAQRLDGRVLAGQLQPEAQRMARARHYVRNRLGHTRTATWYWSEKPFGVHPYPLIRSRYFARYLPTREAGAWSLRLSARPSSITTLSPVRSVLRCSCTIGLRFTSSTLRPGSE